MAIQPTQPLQAPAPGQPFQKPPVPSLAAQSAKQAPQAIQQPPKPVPTTWRNLGIAAGNAPPIHKLELDQKERMIANLSPQAKQAMYRLGEMVSVLEKLTFLSSKSISGY